MAAQFIPHLTIACYRAACVLPAQVVACYHAEFDHYHTTNASSLSPSSWLSLQSQDLFLNQVILDPLVVQHPLPMQYTVRILKQLIDEAERRGNEGLSEALMDLYITRSDALPKGYA